MEQGLELRNLQYTGTQGTGEHGPITVYHVPYKLQVSLIIILRSRIIVGTC